MPDIHEFFGVKRSSSTLIGVDPDREKSGVALYRASTGKIEELQTLSFFDLFDYLKAKRESESDLVVVVEAGHKIQGNWHIRASDSARKAAKVGSYVGGNHQVGQKIIEMCEYLNIPYQEKIPSRRKVDAETFRKITGWTGRTNQECRDAGLLVFGY